MTRGSGSRDPRSRCRTRQATDRRTFLKRRGTCQPSISETAFLRLSPGNRLVVRVVPGDTLAICRPLIIDEAGSTNKSTSWPGGWIGKGGVVGLASRTSPRPTPEFRIGRGGNRRDPPTGRVGRRYVADDDLEGAGFGATWPVETWSRAGFFRNLRELALAPTHAVIWLSEPTVAEPRQGVGQLPPPWMAVPPALSKTLGVPSFRFWT